ncbi:YesL family protein, partial [Enterococcus faecium]|nr:YesL family protein [Enterococcus faecium]
MLQSLDKINGRLNRILQLVYLNFLWGGLVIAGLGVFTFGPASYAMVAVIRKWLRSKETFPLTKTYFTYFNRIRQKSPILYRWVMNAVRYEGYR